MLFRSIAIRIDKSSDCRIVISRLQIVESGFVVVDISAVGEGVETEQYRVERSGAGFGDQLAPCVVFISCYRVPACRVDNRHNVALNVRYIQRRAPDDKMP